MAILCLTKTQPAVLTVEPMALQALTLTRRATTVKTDFGTYLSALSLCLWKALFIFIEFIFFSYNKTWFSS